MTVQWLFYRVPEAFGWGPTTVFTDRFWDDREHWIPPGVGVVPGSLRPYFGPIPSAILGPIFGTPEQWINGVSYSVFQAGGYPLPPCADLLKTVRIARFKQKQSVRIRSVRRTWLQQSQQLLASPPPAPVGVLREAQSVITTLVVPIIDQLRQAQEIRAEMMVPEFGVLNQSQQILAGTSG